MADVRYDVTSPSGFIVSCEAGRMAHGFRFALASCGEYCVEFLAPTFATEPSKVACACRAAVEDGMLDLDLARWHVQWPESVVRVW